MIWACVALMGPGYLTITESMMNSSIDKNILEANMRPWSWKGHEQVMHAHNLTLSFTLSGKPKRLLICT